MKTIFSGNKIKLRPVFAIAYGDGHGYDYRYENWPTRMDRRQAEPIRKTYRKILYRINVYPRLRGVEL